MKKIFFSLLAIAALASCAKTEDVFTEGESEIKLVPVTALQTKAQYLGAVDGITYPVQENFDVYAYWKNVPAGQEFVDGTMFLEGAAAGGAEFTNKGNYWGGCVNYYWPKNGSLRFAAYSPAHLDVDHVLDGDFYSVAYEQPSNTAQTWDFLVAPTSPSYSMMTATEQVAIEFQHALSWITLKVVAKDADAAQAFDITKVTINDVKTTADFAARMGDGIQYNEWANQDTPADYVVFEGNQAVTQTVTNIETTAAGTLVIPQETTSVTIEFDQYGINGTADTPGMTVTLDLVLDTDNTPWEPGKHYNYNLVFGLDEILINPSVADWEEVEVGELDVDAANVTTEAQLLAALANGGKVTLQDNIALSDNKTITVANNVVLDLNGKTLSVNTTTSGNREMFLVKDNLTVQNGTVTTEHTGANMGWSAMTTIFDVTAGGVLSLKNVEAENLGGTDMTFVAHLNNWGEVTLNVDNSTLKANYVAVRVFNSGPNMNNVSIYNSTLEGGSNAFWVHNYTTADFSNNEAKAAAQQALLNFDVFNGTNTFVGAKAFTPVRYGMTNSLYLDASGQAGTTVTTQEQLNAALAANARILLGAGTYTFSSFPAGMTLVGAEDGVVLDVVGKKFAVNGDVTFENVKILFASTNYTGFQHTADSYYKNCTIEGQPFLYGDNATFENCTFEQTSANAYNVWTYGAKNVKFVDCTFNSAGKSVLIYHETAGQNVTLENCVLNASAPVDGKAALEIDSSLINGVYNVTVNNTTANGFGAGNVSGETLWNHKKGSKANIVIDGTPVALVNTVLVATAAELQAALDAASGLEILFTADLAGNVTATQKQGVNVVINGNGYEFDGVLTVNGQSRYEGNETLVIKNVNFATESTAAMDFISSATDPVRYAHNVTIEDCTFTAPEGTDVVAIRFRQAYNIVVNNCVVEGGHSLAQITSSNNIDFNNCTVVSGRGINLQNALNGVANVINCNITATKNDGYGVRVDAKGANELNVKGCTISAYEPIVLRNAEAVYTANRGNNTVVLTNGGTQAVVVLGQTPIINR